jgi:2-phospho-L-lactate guanylyltransferase
VNFVLVPIKALSQGKTRLLAMLSDAARQALSRAMLKDVLASVFEVPAVDRAVVVSSDPSLLALACELGALTVDEGHPRGLNGATEVGTDFCLRQGATTLLVLLSDLPLITSQDIAHLFQQLSGKPEILLVRCKYGDGTNAFMRVPPLVMEPCFGGPSLEAHEKAARRQGIACRVIQAPSITFDLDSVEDLKHCEHKILAPHTAQVLQEYQVFPAGAVKA